MNGSFFPRLGGLGAKTLEYEKEKQGANYKKYKRISGQSVGELLPTSGFKVFFDCESPNVSHSSPGKIARAGVVNGVFPFPVMIGCEGEQTGDEAECVVDLFRSEEGSVSAVVKNNEGTHEKKPSQARKENGDPPTGA